MTSCASQIVPRQYRARDDYEAYTRALSALELHHTALGTEWIESGEAALSSPIRISSSAFEVGYFNPRFPDSAGFSFFAQEGKTIEVTVSLENPEEETRLFADLFRLGAERTPRHVASADVEENRLTFETRRPGEYILRIQPELLRGGRYFLTIRTDATLEFPVQGANADAIWSFFGDPRDGGTRDHHGVDIFAPRNTPVLAPAAGQVVHVQWNKLGGNIVGIWDAERRIYYYFAHLEEQIAQVGQQVQVGDVIGLVGNSGNASAGKPHLHFGMYVDMRDPIDPYHFVTRVAGTLGPVDVDQEPVGLWSRTVEGETELFPDPETSENIGSFPEATPLFVTGAQRNRYRVLLPDGLSGYVGAETIEPASTALGIFETAGPASGRLEPTLLSAVVAEPVSGSVVGVLGWYDSFALAEIDGTPLWVLRSALKPLPEN